MEEGRVPGLALPRGVPLEDRVALGVEAERELHARDREARAELDARPVERAPRRPRRRGPHDVARGRVRGAGDPRRSRRQDVVLGEEAEEHDVGPDRSDLGLEGEEVVPRVPARRRDRCMAEIAPGMRAAPGGDEPRRPQLLETKAPSERVRVADRTSFSGFVAIELTAGPRNPRALVGRGTCPRRRVRSRIRCRASCARRHARRDTRALGDESDVRPRRAHHDLEGRERRHDREREQGEPPSRPRPARRPGDRGGRRRGTAQLRRGRRDGERLRAVRSC